MTSKQLTKELKKLGFELEKVGRHFRFRSPKGKLLVCSISPSCKYAYNHALKDAEKILRLENAT